MRAAAVYRGSGAIILTVLILVLISASASAAPIADITFSETSLGGGQWQYDYTLSNLSDPILDAGFDLYEFDFNFSPTAAFTVLSLPFGWDKIDGPGFVQFFSQNPGEPPLGTDVAPAGSLSGFSIVFDYQPGNLAFASYLADPTDPAIPVVYQGTTTASAVPEPGTFALLASALAAVFCMKKKK
jgi:hypothetical protein